MELELNIFFDVQPSEERNMFAMTGHAHSLSGITYAYGRKFQPTKGGDMWIHYRLVCP
jgi:hypothetical protein